MQLPLYRSAQRETSAPRGFSPGTSQPAARPQTQANNGGPRGFGQPKAPLRMAASPSAPPPPLPPATPASPPALYPPSTPIQTAEQILWANRYTQNPLELMARAGQQVLGQALTADDVQQIIGPAASVEDAMASFGQWLQQQTGQRSAAAGALSPIQSAILGPL